MPLLCAKMSRFKVNPSDGVTSERLPSQRVALRRPPVHKKTACHWAVEQDCALAEKKDWKDHVLLQVTRYMICIFFRLLVSRF